MQILFCLALVAVLVSAYLNLEDLSLPALPYAYNDLEPMIDEATMKVHHQGKANQCENNF